MSEALFLNIAPFFGYRLHFRRVKETCADPVLVSWVEPLTGWVLENQERFARIWLLEEDPAQAHDVLLPL